MNTLLSSHSLFFPGSAARAWYTMESRRTPTKTTKTTQPPPPAKTPPSSSRAWERAFGAAAEHRSPQLEGPGRRFGGSGDHAVAAALAVRSLDMPLLAAEVPAAAHPTPTETPMQTVLKSIMYGLINTIVCTPVMIGFAAIIFRHPAFHKDATLCAAIAAARARALV